MSRTDWSVDIALVTERWHAVHEPLSEAIASAYESQRDGAPEGPVGMLLDALLALWRLRWDLPPGLERDESTVGRAGVGSTRSQGKSRCAGGAR